jgi:SAM-dependent methyltransferase
MKMALQAVGEYYTQKVASFGATAKGADWRDEESQNLRFAQLAKVLEGDNDASVCDLGCGYGAFAGYLRSIGHVGDYEGVDVSEQMIREAHQLLGGDKHCRLTLGECPARKADYVCASGIFNVKLGANSVAWERHVYDVIDVMVDSAVKGVAFNCLTSYSDADRMQDYLHYASPSKILEYCARKHSRWVELSHDYGLFEFTLRLRLDRSWPRIPSDYSETTLDYAVDGKQSTKRPETRGFAK